MRPKLDESAFEGEVRTAAGGFSREDLIIPDAEKDEMASDPSYLDHSISCTQKRGMGRVVPCLEMYAPSPEEVMLANERFDEVCKERGITGEKLARIMGKGRKGKKG